MTDKEKFENLLKEFDNAYVDDNGYCMDFETKFKYKDILDKILEMYINGKIKFEPN